MPVHPSIPSPRRCVVLRHSVPDGSSHHDWMLESQANGSLRTFRVDARPDLEGAFVARSIPDHRRAYLAYEGPVSDGRGHVARVASGTLLEYREDDRTICAVVRWDARGEPTTYLARAHEGEMWEFRRTVTGT